MVEFEGHAAVNVLRLPFGLAGAVLDHGLAAVPYRGQWDESLNDQTFHVATVSPGRHSRVLGVATVWACAPILPAAECDADHPCVEIHNDGRLTLWADKDYWSGDWTEIDLTPARAQWGEAWNPTDGPASVLMLTDVKMLGAPRMVTDPDPEDHDHQWIGIYTIPDPPRLTAIPSRYSFDPPELFQGDDPQAAGRWSSIDSIVVAHRGGDTWAVTTSMSEVWDDTAKMWQYEPSSSSRSDEFLARTRYDLDTALALAERLANDPWPEKP